MTKLCGAKALIGILLACGSTAALAQAEQAAPAADERSPGAAALDDIVVTAQKRSENLQDVPISVATIGSEALRKSQAVTTRDLQFAVPTLVYNSAANNAQPFLRGIGSDTNGPNYDVSVATYIDGVFISSNSGTIQGLLGIDRVEVLEGPQGTLYGRNAVAGAINLYTLTPEQDLKARVSATYGNYDRTAANAYVSGGVTDTLSVGIYGAYNRRDTYYRKVNDTPDPDHETMWGVRLKAVWEPTDAIKLTGSAEYLHSKSFETGVLRNIQPDALGYALGYAPNIDRYLVDSDQQQFARTKTYALTLREEVDLGWSTLLGITGYRNLKLKAFDDLDGTSAPLLGTGAPLLPSKQFSQELQLLSPAGSAVTWIAGVYYFRENTGYSPVVTTAPGGFIFPAPITTNAANTRILTDSYAIFGQATIPIDAVAEGMRLTLGGRYTIDRKAFRGNSFNLDANGDQVGPTIVYPDDKHSWRKFTPKITLDYKIDDTLVYATFSKGFKSGAYNSSSPADPGPVDPENLSAYEVGFKTELLDRRLRLNAAGYYYDFADLQVQRVDGTSGRTLIQNAAQAEAYGVQLSTVAAITSTLTINASGALAHTRYKSFPDAATYLIGPGGNAPAAIDATGNQLQRAPEFVSTVGADWTLPLANGGEIAASAKWYHNDGYYWEATNRFRQKAYDLVNASIGYTFPDEHLNVTAFVTNLTKAKYQTSLLLLPVSVVSQDAEPRMYGITVGWTM